jgi:hypothetical protein
MNVMMLMIFRLRSILKVLDLPIFTATAPDVIKLSRSLRTSMLVKKYAGRLEKLSFDSELPHGESFQPSGLFEGHQGSLVRGQSLADGVGLLWAQVQGDVLVGLVKIPQVLFPFLVHHNADPGDGLADDSKLGELGGRSTGHLGNSEAPQLSLEVLKLLDQLFFLLLMQLGALDYSHFASLGF